MGKEKKSFTTGLHVNSEWSQLCTLNGTCKLLMRKEWRSEMEMRICQYSYREVKR